MLVLLITVGLRRDEIVALEQDASGAEMQDAAGKKPLLECPSPLCNWTVLDLDVEGATQTGV